MTRIDQVPSSSAVSSAGGVSSSFPGQNGQGRSSSRSPLASRGATCRQQITEGNLIPNIDRAWGEIGYFQVGDNPGRNEPGTGEINYNRVFRHIHAKGFTGIVGMEHGLSQGGKQGERAVIDAYRKADDFSGEALMLA